MSVQKLAAEGLGTAMLLISVVGSGIMGETLANGNIAVALLANAVATGCMLWSSSLCWGRFRARISTPR
jgi:glycerol uptake facilitator-like aquaporin